MKAFNTCPYHKETKNKISERSGKRGVVFDEAFGELVREGLLVPCEITKENGQTYDGYERIYPENRVSK